MSHNQSRAERSESTQYRKTGRSGSSNQHRQFSGVSTKGGGSASSALINLSNRGFKKYNSNAPVGQPNARSANVDSSNSPAPHAVQNGAHQQHPTNKVSEAPIISTTSNAKLIDAPTQSITLTVPRAPSSNISSAAIPSNVSTSSSESKAPTTPGKAQGDASKSFPLQFGSISPGFMNGVQIPARTSSAPPNLDEQKRDQARHESLRAPAAEKPVPSIPNQHFPKKDAGILSHPNAGEVQLVSKSKRDAQVSAALPVSQPQKPLLHPIPGMSMQLPYHQPQVPLQFGGPNPQIQSQAISGTPLAMPIPMPMPMPMPMPLPHPPVQHSMFLPGLQPHPMQSQGMMHPGQSLNFSSQMGTQLPPQIGNMGINMAPQFPQQPAVKYSGSRKTVKITHPDTHEELRLVSPPAPRLHPNVQSHSQPISSFPPNIQTNFYPTYNANSLRFPAGSSVPLNSTQVPPTSQPARLHNQVTVKLPVGSHGEKELLPPTGSLSVGKGESLKPSRLPREDSVFPHKEIEPSSSSTLSQPKPGLGTSYASVASSSPVVVERDVSYTSASASDPMDGSASASTSTIVEARNGVVVPDSIKDKHKKQGNRGQQDQVGSPQTSLSSLSESEAVEAKSASSGTNLVSENAKGSLTIVAASSEASNSTNEGAREERTVDMLKSFEMKGVNSRHSKPHTIERKEQGESTLTGCSEPSKHCLETSLSSLSLESPKIIGKIEENADQEVKSTTGVLSKHILKELEESSSSSNDVRTDGNLAASTRTLGGQNSESSVSVTGLSMQGDNFFTSDASLSGPDSIDMRGTTIAKYDLVDQVSAPDLVPYPSEGALGSGIEDIHSNGGGLVSLSPSSVKDKVLSDSNVAKSAAPRCKKKRKELDRKAEAAGTSSDIYMACKGPEEKKETVTAVEGSENSSSIGEKQTSADVSQGNAVPCERTAQVKVEPDDWEDATEISTPHLEISKNKSQDSDRDGYELTTKRYSRDFLLKFVEQFTDLPEGFELASDVADMLMVSNVSFSCESYPSAGRNLDRSFGGSKPDCRGNGLGDEGKWNRTSVPGPGQGGNYGGPRNPRGQTPVHFVGGILPGPLQLGQQGGPQRNNSDSDRWQRGTGFQKGLMSYPQMPMQVMHKADKKYEIGKVTDEEEAKQRQLKGILNKLTPQNFEKLFQQVKQVNIDNVITLSGVISQIFYKALMEPTFCEMYANFCSHLAADLPDLSVDNERITFKRLLLNKCQEEFERGEREEEEANKAEEDGEVQHSAEEREEKRLQARRRMLGNIRLIGELFKERMLTERIMHECINKLLGQHQTPDEENIEALCKLMSTIGEMIDYPKAKEYMDAYFDIMAKLSNNMKLSSRVRFMLKDSIDLRKNKWQQRRKVEGPKKIEEVHRDAAQERQTQASRLARGPSMGNSVRRGSPMDFAPRSTSMLFPPSSQIGGFRAAPPQPRGYGSQDVRIEERSSENKAMSVPLPQRPLGEGSITLGPQGGLARGMAFRGHPSAPSIPLAEMPSPGNARRMGPGQNGFSSMPERAANGQKEDLMLRYMPDRVAGPPIYEQSHPQERNSTYGSREIRNTDRSFDRTHPTSSHTRGVPPTSIQNASSDKVLPEELLQEKSMAAIKEFYSARDRHEVALCIKELNTPSFYPSMISIWVTDSFERKDMERDLLTELLINLARPGQMISQDQLMRGFGSVLAVLEDAMNDVPRAAEFLGRIFAKAILENIISLSHIGQLIYKGGEEQGQLVETGVAAEVLGSILDIIKSEKGESVLNEIRSSCNLRLEDFRPPGSKKSLRIDKFI